MTLKIWFHSIRIGSTTHADPVRATHSNAIKMARGPAWNSNRNLENCEDDFYIDERVCVCANVFSRKLFLFMFLHERNMSQHTFLLVYPTGTTDYESHNFIFLFLCFSVYALPADQHQRHQCSQSYPVFPHQCRHGLSYANGTQKKSSDSFDVKQVYVNESERHWYCAHLRDRQSSWVELIMHKWKCK